MEGQEAGEGCAMMACNSRDEMHALPRSLGALQTAGELPESRIQMAGEWAAKSGR